MEIFDTWWRIINDGLHHINPFQFLVLALLFGLTASSMMGVLIGALAASVVYVAIDVLWPVLFHHVPFAMPAFDTPFFHFFVSLYFAFLVVVLLLYVVRNVISSLRG